MNPTVSFLQSVYDRSVGPGATPRQIQRVQLWDLYSTIPMYNDVNLAGTQFSLFTQKKNDNVVGPGFVAASPPYLMRDADTNIESPGSIPFDMFVHGMSADFINRQYTPGTVGGANDMAFWPRAKDAMLQDTYLAFNVNNMDIDTLTMVEAPAAAGLWLGGAAQGTTAALTVGASISQANNGVPSVGNYRNYANEGPIFMPVNTSFKVNGTFGNSVLAASTVYKPAGTGAPAIFIKVVLRGFRIWWAQ